MTLTIIKGAENSATSVAVARCQRRDVNEMRRLRIRGIGGISVGPHTHPMILPFLQSKDQGQSAFRT